MSGEHTTNTTVVYRACVRCGHLIGPWEVPYYDDNYGPLCVSCWYALIYERLSRSLYAVQG